MPKLNTFGLTVIAAIMAMMTLVPAPAQSQTKEPEYRYPHLSAPRREYYQQHPEEFQQLLKSMPLVSHELVPGTMLAPGQQPTSGTWTSLNNPAGVNLMNPLLLTDGTVMAHVSCTSDWYKFTPDNTGSYINGTWAQIASTGSNYGPRFFGSSVLPDGRVIMEGGEYNTGCRGRTMLGAIYDPVANSWTPVAPPPGWSTISDAAGIVLPNGTYMQTSCCDTPTPHAALLNPSTLTWTNTGTGKFDVYDEEAMAQLHDGTVLTVDAYVFKGASCGQGSERYDPSTGAWTSAGNVGNQQADCNSSFPSFEVGPLVMRPNGTAVTFSGLTTGVAGTAIYDATAHTWTVGQNIPQVGGVNYTLADAPAAVLPNGNILFAASPGDWTASEQFRTPMHFFEMSIVDNSITQVADKADALSGFGAWEENFLVLPTGQIMVFTIDGPTVQIYAPAGSPNPSWAPVITSVPSSLDPGQTFSLSGTQLNGLSEGAYYGDDTNASTNFPLVRITNNATSHVFYARTFNHSSRSIAPGATSSTSFTVPALIESGASTLVVVANGIPSAPVAVTISNDPALVVTSAAQINASGAPGGSFSPSFFTYQLSATHGTVNYSISGLPTWLTASSTSGTVGAVAKNITFTVNASANTLAGGIYGPTTITFTNTSNGVGTVNRTATLNVSNDNFSAAIPIQAGQILLGSNVGATKESGEPDPFGNGGKSVWWKFTAPAAGNFNVNTIGSNFDTVLGIYTGSAVNALTLVGSDDDSGGNHTSSKTFTAVAGTTYYFLVDGWLAASGNIQIELTAGASLALDVTPVSDIAASGSQGGPIAPASFQYQLGSSTGSVNYSISGLPAWLTASSASGTATISPTVVTFTVNSNANSLSPGTYNATISFTNTTNAQGNQTRNATLTVSTPPVATTSLKTYVSPKTGTDTGICPVTAPCATLNYALSVTNAGGEVIVLSSGVFGPIIITQPVTIDGFKADSVEIYADPAAQVGCIGVSPANCALANNGFAVEIAAGTSDSVKLAHVLIGAGNSGGAGALKLSSGRTVQLSENIYRGNDTQTGPIIALYANNPGTTQVQVYFSNSDVGFNNSGANAGAVEVKPSGNTSLKLHFNHVEVHNASYGIRTDSSLLSGPSVNVATAISESEMFSFANAAVNAFSIAGAGTTTAAFDAVRILNASTAIKANGPLSTVILTNSTVSGNGTGVQVLNGAHVYTPQNNTIFGNGADLSGSLSSSPPK